MRLLLIIAALFFVLPALSIYSSHVGLDETWRIALQVAFDNNFIFGKDFIFTYGPLGFVSSRLLAESTKPLVITYDIFVTLQFFLAPFFILNISSSTITAVMILIAYVTIGSTYYIQDPATTLFILSTFFIFYDKYKSSPFAFILSLINALLCFYIKLNMGLAALLQITAITFFSIFDKRKTGASVFKLLLIFAALFGSTFIVNVSFFDYLKASLHIADGFNDAMYLQLKDVTQLNKAIGLISLLILTAFITFIVERRILIALSSLGFCFLLFKQGFVRADEHIYIFLDYISITFAFLALFTVNLRTLNTCIFTGVSIFVLLNRNIDEKFIQNKYNSYLTYFNSLKSLEVKTTSPTIPESLVKIAGNRTSDMMPYNGSQLYHAGLNYYPRPVIQSYTAYDQYLDSINAAFIRERGQDNIFLSHGCTDYRYCLWDETEAKIALMENYEVVASEGDLLLLNKRASPSPYKRTLIQKGTHRLEKEFKLKNTGAIQVIKFFVKYSLKGKITRFFYKPPPLSVTFNSGLEKFPFRAVVPIINAGVIANLDVRDTPALNNLVSGNLSAIPTVNSLRFQTEFNWAYEPEFDYEVYELTK